MQDSRVADYSPIDGWVRLLQRSTQAVQESIIQALTRTNEGISRLVDSLEYIDDATLRDYIFFSFKEKNITIPANNSAMLKLLLHPNPEIRLYMVDLLECVLSKTESKELLPMLLSLLKDRDDFVAVRAGVLIMNSSEQMMEKYYNVNDNLEALLSQIYLNNNSEISCINSIIAMSQHGLKYRKFIMKILKNSSEVLTRRSLSIALLRISTQNRELVLSLLSDADPVIRCITVKHIDDNFDNSYRQYLIEACTDETPIVRFYAACSLANHNFDNSVSLSILRPLLLDEHPRVRFAAAFTLSCVEKIDHQIVIALIDLLNDHDINVRFQAASSLQFAPEPVESINALLRLLLSEKNESVRRIASDALHCLARKLNTEEPVIDFIIHLYSFRNREIRMFAIKFISCLPHFSDKVMRVMVDALSDENPAIRLIAAENIHQFPIHDLPLVFSTVNSFRDSDERIRRAIMRLILTFPHSAISAVKSTLLEALSDTDVEVRLLAARAISLIDPSSEVAITTLIEILLTNPNCDIRRLSAKALGKFCQNFDITTPALQYVLNTDQDNGVIVEVSNLLKKGEEKTAM